MNTGYFVQSMRTKIVEYRVTRRRRRRRRCRRLLRRRIAVDSGH